MSTISSELLKLACVGALIALTAIAGAAQGMEAVIKLNAGAEPSAVVTGRLDENAASVNFSFIDGVAGVPGLAGRMSGLELFGADGRRIDGRVLAPGEILAGELASSFRYVVNLAPIRTNGGMAHVSWASGGTAVMRPYDLLPRVPADRLVRLRIEVPDGWNISTTETRAADGSYLVKNVSRAVFAAGNDLRASVRQVAGTAISVERTGTWLFDEADPITFAAEIASGYSALFGGMPGDAIKVLLIRKEGPPGQWEADTTGRTVTIVSTDMAFKAGSVQRLHEQLRHELFHLWLPYSIELAGDHAWFYEGTALYVSLRSGVLTGRLRFDDLLDTLTRAYSIGKAGSGGGSMSLIELSKNRWAGSDTQVYARGMIAAFMIDLAMLKASKGRSGIESVLKRLFVDRASLSGKDALSVISGALKAGPTAAVWQAFIAGGEPVEIDPFLSSTGLEMRTEGSKRTLAVKPRLTASEKVILDKLGYNAWRKLT